MEGDGQGDLACDVSTGSGEPESSGELESYCSTENVFFVSVTLLVASILSEPESMTPGPAIQPLYATKLFSC